MLFSIEPNVWLQLGLIVFILVMIGVLIESLYCVFKNFREDKLWAFVPLIVCLLSIPAPLMAGAKLKSYLFQYRLPMYTELVSRVQASNENYEGELTSVELKEDDNHLAYVVFAIKEEEVLYVEFVTGGGFPVKHTGYIYSQSGNIPDGSKINERWPKKKRWKISDNWYGFSG